MEPLVRSCANCEFFDGDVHCTLPDREQLITGTIKEAELVVCAKHEVSSSDHHWAMLKAEDKAKSVEGISYENALYRAGGRY